MDRDMVKRSTTRRTGWERKRYGQKRDLFNMGFRALYRLIVWFHSICILNKLKHCCFEAEKKHGY